MIQDVILASVLCVGVYVLNGYVKHLCRSYFLQRSR